MRKLYVCVPGERSQPDDYEEVSCATCRWWNRDEADAAVEGVPVLATCRVILHSEERPRPGGEEELVPDYSDKAYVTDGSGYTGWLHTSADFGCVLWEAKP